MLRGMDEKRIAAQIGSRIRRARTANSMTLATLAQRAGLSEAFLSRVERGEASSSIANLVQICAVLGLGFQDLLAEGDRPDRTETAVYRADDRDRHVELESTGYHWHRVTGGAPRDRIEVFHLVFPRRNKMPVMVSHPGQEHCYVLSGEIFFFVGGERYRLRAGDSIFIASEQPHRAENAGDIEAHVLMTVAKPEHEPAALDWWRMPIAEAGQRSRKLKSRTKEETS
jgi:quercetin dioxygenase-like cupin family protein/DNA-binding Xre family transcriptional regulator